jgi:hypothetical protein
MDLKIQSGKLFGKIFVNNKIRKQHWDRRIVCVFFKLNKKETLIEPTTHNHLVFL